MPRRFLPPSRLVLALGAVLAASACDDASTLPASAPGGGPRATLSAGADARFQKPAVIPNTTRYRWSGHRPATGRSGSAGLTVQALAGRDGITEVKVASHYAGYPWWSQGTLEKVQSRAFAPGGAPMFTANHNALSGEDTATFEYRGLARGAVLQVQANVSGVDPHRVDVVTVTDSVMLRPNLAVTDVQAPARIAAGTQAVVSATVQETNGDVGAQATCTLYVNGDPVDWSYFVWVDAGDAVTCAFYHMFRGAGPQQVSVDVSEVSPRDDFAGDDAASTTVEVLGTDKLTYTLSASESVSRSSTLWIDHWRSGTFESDWRETRTDERTSQIVTLKSWLPRALTTNTPHLEISESSGGVTTVSGTYDVVPDWSWGVGDFCFYRRDRVADTYLHLCSRTEAGGYTSLEYSRFAGSVTYHSSAYIRQWDRLSGEEYVYTINESGHTRWGSFTPFGADFAMRVRLHDGETVLAIDPAFPLRASEGRYDEPLECWTYEEEAWDYFSEWCSEYRSEWSSLSGYAYN